MPKKKAAKPFDPFAWSPGPEFANSYGGFLFDPKSLDLYNLDELRALQRYQRMMRLKT